MRSQNKYKSYDQSIQIFERFPLRVLKFKSTKWKRIQKILLSKLSKLSKKVKKKFKNRKPKRFKDNLSVKVNFRIWEKVKSFYQNGRKITNTVFNSLDKSIAISNLKEALLNSKLSRETLDIYRQTLLKPEFKLSILLWKLNFFSSSFQASQAISEKKVYINGVSVKTNFFLLKGDIIHLKAENYKKNTAVRKSKLFFSPSDIILSFVEIDYYTSAIVIVKSFEDLSAQDFRFFKQEFYNLKKVKDYI